MSKNRNINLKYRCIKLSYIEIYNFYFEFIITISNMSNNKNESPNVFVEDVENRDFQNMSQAEAINV